MSSDRVCRISTALFDAPAATLVRELRDRLREEYGASEAEVLIADYRQATLRSLDGDEREIPIDGSPHGRVFASGDPLVENGVTLLRLSARGRRLGVLEIRPTLPGDVAELTTLAGLAGCALALAERETDRFHRARRRRRLTVPAEIQWDLLPAETLERDEFALAAHLEPAYAVAGDNFDWALDGRRLTVTVSNGMGGGMRAALLTTLAVGALRNARRSGADLAEQAGQAGDALHARYGGQEFVETLLLEIDTVSGSVDIVDAGSPLLLHSPGGGPFGRIKLEQQLPLGMFTGTTYVTERLRLRPGDRLLAISDGVHNALSPGEEEFGLRSLDRAVRSSRRFPAAEAVRALIRDLYTFRQGDELGDDAVALCLDWKERGEG